MQALKLERFMVGVVGVVVAVVVAVNAALFVKAEFETATAAFAKIGAVPGGAVMATGKAPARGFPILNRKVFGNELKSSGEKSQNGATHNAKSSLRNW